MARKSPGGLSRRVLVTSLLAAAMAAACPTVARADWLGHEDRLTSGPGSRLAPQLSGDRVAYLVAAQGTVAPQRFAVRVLDLTDGTDVAVSDAATGAAALSGDVAAWPDARGGVTTLDLRTGVERRHLTGSVDQVALSGNRACFTRSGRVGVLDLGTGREWTVSSPGAVAGGCDLSGAVVAWQERIGADSAVLVGSADGLTRTRLSAPGAVAAHPRVDADLVVWSEARSGDGGDIRVHDLADGTTRTVAAGPGAQSAPDVCDGLVVWTDDRAGRGNAEVYLRDLATAVETRVTREEGWSGNPSISSGRIAWEDARGTGRHVYARTLTPPALQPVFELSGDAVALAGRLTDTDGVPVVAADVVLQVATADGPWHDAGRATTAGDGSYRLALPDGLGSGLVRVSFAGSHSHPPASSDVVSLPALP